MKHEIAGFDVRILNMVFPFVKTSNKNHTFQVHALKLLKSCLVCSGPFTTPYLSQGKVWKHE